MGRRDRNRPPPAQEVEAPMQVGDGSRRSRGTGSLYTRKDKSGRERWYGHWRDAEGKQVKRVIGSRRQRGSRDGLTKPQAEQKLRHLMEGEEQAAGPSQRRALEEVARSWIDRRTAANLKPSTLEGYGSAVDVHIVAFFRGRSVAKLSAEDVVQFIKAKKEEGCAPKSVQNYVGVLHSIFELAVRKKWATANPCQELGKDDKPSRRGPHGDIRFLEEAEIEALWRAEGGDELGEVLRVLYLFAAMTGLRQGECIALRWRDVDWRAARVRVRRSYVRKEYGSPKSRRSTRSVPLADRVAGELDRLYQRSAFQGDDDLVFAHPELGAPLDRSKVRKRFKSALRRAKVRDVRFHDLRHTFGTRMAAAGVPMRTLMEWMGHASISTTEIYADYSPSAHEAEWINQAFGEGNDGGNQLSETESTSAQLSEPNRA
jgi:integrase